MSSTSVSVPKAVVAVVWTVSLVLPSPSSIDWNLAEEGNPTWRTLLLYGSPNSSAHLYFGSVGTSSVTTHSSPRPLGSNMPT
ncbi:hypothetical protein E2562_013674 [Oryza meyeriana var. granulata]|uniref:Secreted protein n=1 Tax=Oryza meyeriana var. granulata TaxID=110450 RepID=A0A6G1BJR4_9ORYZ|nr:hypothetical protein E2562_013674 [Oryza meyeriana var. granulata]